MRTPSIHLNGTAVLICWSPGGDREVIWPLGEGLAPEGWAADLTPSEIATARNYKRGVRRRRHQGERGAQNLAPVPNIP